MEWGITNSYTESKKMEVKLFRHWRTKHNVNHVIMGQKINEGLMDFAENEILSKLVFNNMKFDKIYVSPLKRSIQTANIISKICDSTIVKDKRLTETDYGKLSGKTRNEINSILEKKSITIDDHIYFDYSKYEGERYDEVLLRITSFMKDLYSKGGAPLIITHSGIIRLIYFLTNNEILKNIEFGKLYSINLTSNNIHHE
jgi:broad specificity phosphatase PhoE